MNLKIAGWYSPITGRFWTEEQAMSIMSAGNPIAEDSIPLTYAYETKRLQLLLMKCQEENKDLICALDSVREDLKKLEDDFK